MTALTPPVKKACDACHRRKVRCTGGQPCKNCGQASLQCTYLAIPQKKGPKGTRAKVISEIRDTQQQSAPLVSPTRSHKHEQSPFDFNASPLPPSYYHTQTPGLLSQQTIDICINFFFEHLYPTLPIFKQQRLLDMIDAMDTAHPETYCLLASLCAFIMVQPGMTLSVSGIMGESYEGEPPSSRYGYASSLIEDLLRVRKGIDYVESPTLLTVQTSFFLFSSYFSLEKQNACWFHLREAATIAQMMGMHEEATYLSGDAVENMHKRRTYWLILVTERAYAMERHKPLTLYHTIELPAAEGPDEEIINGFLYLISLFLCIDDEFMGLWNKAKSECSTAWLSRLQQQLLDALPPELKTTKYQAADIKITQQWLRTMVWQLSITNGNLSSNSPDSAMTFKYPIDIAKDLLLDLQKIDVPSMEVHGVGLIEKLFDVACTLTDVIACVPLDNTSSHPQPNPSDFLNQFLNLISQLRGGSSRYLPLLLAKVSENLPSMAAPIHHMPLSIKQGYAGASDNMPTPMLPAGMQQGMMQEMMRDRQSTPASTGMSQSGLNQAGLSYVSTTPSVEGGMMLEAYSPSVGGGNTPMTPPSGYLGQPLLAPMPRSVPRTDAGLLFDGYQG